MKKMRITKFKTESDEYLNKLQKRKKDTLEYASKISKKDKEGYAKTRGAGLVVKETDKRIIKNIEAGLTDKEKKKRKLQLKRNKK